MPDIAMCVNSTCPLRVGCYRYLAAPNPYRQAYSYFRPTTEAGEEICDHHLELEPQDKLLPVDEVDALHRKDLL